MDNIKLIGLVSLKMAQIWGLGLIGCLVLLICITRLKSDSRWLKRLYFKIGNI